MFSGKRKEKEKRGVKAETKKIPSQDKGRRERKKKNQRRKEKLMRKNQGSYSTNETSYEKRRWLWIGCSSNWCFKTSFCLWMYTFLFFFFLSLSLSSPSLQIRSFPFVLFFIVSSFSLVLSLFLSLFDSNHV